MKKQRIVLGLSEESEIYSKHSCVYEEFSKAEDAQNKLLNFLVPRVKDKVVVDFGCGNGKYASLLKNHVKSYVGVDISENQIQTAKSKLNDKKVRFIKSSIEKVPLAEKYADVIISTWVIGSVKGEEHKKASIKEAERILKTNGVIYLIENDAEGEFQEIRGKNYSEKARLYNEWLVKEGFVCIEKIDTHFDFETVEKARNVFNFIWGPIVTGINSKNINHKIIVFKKEKREKTKDILKRVRESSGYVVRMAEFVHIDPTAIDNFTKSLNANDFNHWLEDAPSDFTKLSLKQRLHLLLLFNAISFSYWGTPKWSIDYKGKNYDGSWAMLLSFIRAHEEGKPIFKSRFLSKLTLEEMKEIIRGNTEIPLLQERLNNLKEVGKILEERYRGDFQNVLVKANHDALKLATILIAEFPCFTDVAEYNGKTIYFFKRAQELIGDIHRWFNGKGIGKLSNIEHLTACADYKLPQILREVGILEYAPVLANKIDSRKQIPRGSKEEIEIRASTILVVDILVEQLKKKIPNLLAADINDYLWLKSQTKKENRKPYHLVRTTAY